MQYIPQECPSKVVRRIRRALFRPAEQRFPDFSWHLYNGRRQQRSASGTLGRTTADHGSRTTADHGSRVPQLKVAKRIDTNPQHSLPVVCSFQSSISASLQVSSSWLCCRTETFPCLKCRVNSRDGSGMDTPLSQAFAAVFWCEATAGSQSLCNSQVLVRSTDIQLPDRMLGSELCWRDQRPPRRNLHSDQSSVLLEVVAPEQVFRSC